MILKNYTPSTSWRYIVEYSWFFRDFFHLPSIDSSNLFWISKGWLTKCLLKWFTISFLSLIPFFLIYSRYSFFHFRNFRYNFLKFSKNSYNPFLPILLGDKNFFDWHRNADEMIHNVWKFYKCCVYIFTFIDVYPRFSIIIKKNVLTQKLVRKQVTDYSWPLHLNCPIMKNLSHYKMLNTHH